MTTFLRFLFVVQIFCIALIPQSYAGFCMKPQSSAVDAELLKKAFHLDQINEIYNRTIFKKSLVETLQRGKGDASGLEWVRVTQQLNALKKYLNSLPNIGKTATTKELADLVEKANKINFLFEDTVYKQLSFSDRRIFEDARKAMLYHGMHAFFKLGLKEPGLTRRFFGGIGQLISPRYIHTSKDLAWKMAWDGFEKTKASLDQELSSKLGVSKPTRDFAVRNFIRSMFVYFLVAEIMLPIYQYGPETLEDYRAGRAQILQEATDAENAAKELNQPQKITSSVQQANIENAIKAFKASHDGRDPDPLERSWFEAQARGDEAQSNKILQQLIEREKQKAHQAQVPRQGKAPQRSAYKEPPMMQDDGEIRWTFQEFPDTAKEPTVPEDN